MVVLNSLSNGLSYDIFESFDTCSLDWCNIVTFALAKLSGTVFLALKFKYVAISLYQAL